MRSKPSGSVRLQDVEYADDTTLLSWSWGNAQRQWFAFLGVTKAWGLTVSIKKTKHMVAGMDDTNGEVLTTEDSGPPERVH